MGKLTAVEWLEVQIYEGLGDIDTFAEAKQMEKEQIINAWVDGNDNEPKEVIQDFAKHYYNETFNK